MCCGGRQCVIRSTYSTDCQLGRALSRQTPYATWTGSKSPIDHVRFFGCVTHMKVLNVHTNKLDDRCIKVINLRKEPGTKAYRLYNPLNNRVYVRRDIVFDKIKHWPWNRQELREKDHLEYFSIPDIYTIETDEQSRQSNVNTDVTGGDAEVIPHSSPMNNLKYENYDDSSEPKRY